MSLTDHFLQTAFAIGVSLARDAIWHGECCTWLTPDIQYGKTKDQLVIKNIGHGIYDGQAGIIHFLLPLYEKTKDPIIFKTLTGSIKALVDFYNPKSPFFEYYNGNLGILSTILEASITIGQKEWEKFAEREIEKFLNTTIDNEEPDFLLGLSGTVQPIIKIQRLLKDFELNALLQNIGASIISKANKQEAFWNWKTPVDQNFLTGHSHGTSGVAFALLQIFECTKIEEFWDAAMMALEYERHRYHPEQQNWFDLRGQSDPRYQPRCATSWCHGAPGITLSRLKAWQLSPAPTFVQQIRIALDTTMHDLYQCINGPWEEVNYSLCHGISGNADILLTGSQIIQEQAFIDAAVHAGEYGVEWFANTGLDWPGGLQHPETGKPLNLPGLFLGKAGTGYFYLRLADPSLASIL